jgi:hypothetical protein
MNHTYYQLLIQRKLKIIFLLLAVLFFNFPLVSAKSLVIQYPDTTKKVSESGNKSDLAIANLLQQKKEYKINHDFNRPFVAHGNGVDSEVVLFQSVLTRYQKGHKSQTLRPGQAFIGSKFSINNGTSYRLGCYNTGLVILFTEAFLHGRRVLPRNRVILEVKDPTKLTSDLQGAKYVQWLEENGYCYELIMPVAVGRAAVYTQMQQDLKRMFPQYRASIEKRSIECLALTRTSSKDKLKTKGGQPGGNWDHFGFMMQNYYGLSYIDIKANLSNIEALNEALAAYDLKFVREFHPIDVLVIADSGLGKIDFDIDPAEYTDMPRNFDWEPLKKGGILR